MTNRRYCILFYKYHPLTNDRDELEIYRSATETLCASLNLTGRVLIGLSKDGEGINGTLAGMKEEVDAYVTCMLGGDFRCDAMTEAGDDDEDNNWRRRRDSVLAFRDTSKQFFHRLNCPELLLDSPDDFKWSSDINECNEDWFPDLNIKIVKEIISSGGAFANIDTSQTSVGYLSPREWHDEIRKLVDKEKRSDLTKIPSNTGWKKGCDEIGDNSDDDIDTIVIDVRNHKECQIGSFAPGISIEPKTKTFAQFPKWVKDNSTSNTLTNKKILLYCTGGIRCEKASAYIRELVPENKGIYHLKGGIHKYLEEFGGRVSHAEEDRGGEVDNDECLFVGKNFVFDRRGALEAKGHGIEGMTTTADDVNVGDMIVGTCLYCREPYDIFHPATICTVCREPVLVCKKCRLSLNREQKILRKQLQSNKNIMGNAIETTIASCMTEYHCDDHYQYKKCYFTNITGFSVDECRRQLEELQSYKKTLEVLGRKGKHKRRTLRKQMEKIEAYLIQMTCSDTTNNACFESTFECRHCGSPTCASDCWGFHGGNTRMVNKSNKIRDVDNIINSGRRKMTTRVSSNQREGKRLKRKNDAMEIETLQLCCPPSHHRNYATGFRVPPPVVRILRSRVKGRWCGKTVGWVLANEFGVSREHADESLDLITAGLVRINGVPVKSLDAVLQNNDTFERIVHWHEPPVIIPQQISLSKHRLPEDLLAASDNPTLYCINKPSTVPVYPAGPYYSNSLLLMVEAQEGLPPKTLIPLHRIDRATSGVMLCASTSSAAGVIQGKIANKTQNDFMKLYLARVKGKFPTSVVDSPRIPDDVANITSIAWCAADGNVIEVNAPIDVQHEDGEQSSMMMHRTVRCNGKHSTSRFKRISYNESTDQSLISCAPITGRSHQLRVHLQLIGFPIHNDVEYGGSKVDNESMNKQKTISGQSMLEVSASTSVCRHEATLTSIEVESAIRLCKCCSAGLYGIRASFNSAQLLGEGHAIDLHSYKYCITFKGNELAKQKLVGNETGNPNDEENYSVVDGASLIELTTDLPSWATLFGDLTPNALAWLKEICLVVSICIFLCLAALT